MTDSFTGQRSDELLYNLPAQPAEPEIKWSWPTYEVQREYFDRRDDSLRARKFARHLDTFRQVPPDDRDIQRLAERHGARYLMIQVCANGTPQANRTVWREVMQDARVIGGEQPATQQLAQHVVTGAANMPPQPETVTPHALSGLANTAREFKDLATVLNPPAPAAPALTAADIERIAADAAARVVEQAKPMQPQSSQFDLVQKLEELADRRAERDRQMRESIRAEIAAMMPKESAPQVTAPDLSDEQRLQIAFLNETGALPKMFKELREVLGTVDRVDEPETWLDWGKDLIREFIPHVAPIVAPVVGGRLISLLSKFDDAALMQAAGGGQPTQAAEVSPDAPPPGAPMPPTQAAQQPPSGEEEATQVTFESVLTGLITDLQESNEPDEGIDDIVKLITLQPAYLPVISKMILQPNAQLVEMLCKASGVDLTHLLNTDEYIDALRDGLKKRIRLPELSAPVVPASNGNGASAQAQ